MHPPDHLWPGKPYPLGSTFDGNGTNFALFSQHAHAIELCVFDQRGEREVARMPLPEFTDGVWHGYLPEAQPGLVYGYRVSGPFEPTKGHRFDARQLLLDPYAKQWIGHLSLDSRPKCVVHKNLELERSHCKKTYSRAESIIYEAHVKGISKLNSNLPVDKRGSFAGLGEAAIIDYLVDLGITAIELMPIQAFVDEPRLLRQGLTNYWGYNPIGFFIPEPRYCATVNGLAELQQSVSALHRAGIEVLLDVVYNHSGEGDVLGPTLSFRGIDNKSYYLLDEEKPVEYIDNSGCGNTLNIGHPRVLQLVMDSLRYWVEVVGIDGFRFDLAVSLGRDGKEFHHDAAFFSALSQDPVLAGVKLIAEPWDLGNDGYQLGQFGAGWGEWNDRFRDTVRGFWRGDEGMLPEMAACLLGSADRFDHSGKRPHSVINYITAHDGYTLADLVSYEQKHNEANGEENKDGHDHNISWNHGVEGESDDPIVINRRKQDRINLFATLLFSQGIPMLSMGDELGRTQNGNNNAYCQDNEISWLNWQQLDEKQELLSVVKQMIKIRRQNPVFHCDNFLHGEIDPKCGRKNITWLRPDGQEMNDHDWQSTTISNALIMLLDSQACERFETFDDQQMESRYLLILNAGSDPLDVRLPAGSWVSMLDHAQVVHADIVNVDEVSVEAASFALLEQRL